MLKITAEHKRLFSSIFYCTSDAMHVIFRIIICFWNEIPISFQEGDISLPIF